MREYQLSCRDLTINSGKQGKGNRTTSRRHCVTPASKVTVLTVTVEEEKPKWASEFCAAMAREVQSALASKPTPAPELSHHRETSTLLLRASGVAK